MATATWPATLPSSFLLDGFVETAPDNVIASEMEVGPPKTRRRSSAAVRRISGTLILTSTQLGVHDTFFTDTLYDGANPFDWADPRTTASCEFLYVPGQPPVYTPIGGGDFRVTINLLKLP